MNTLRLKLFETAVGAQQLSPGERAPPAGNRIPGADQQILDKEGDLEQIYADPNVADPRAATAPLRQELAGLYARRDQIGPIAEAILQEQIGIIVSEQGLSVGGQPVPPVLYHSTPLPLILVVSPRDMIRLDYSIALDPALTLDKQVELEDQVDHALNLSSLVEPIGGLGLYPTMVVQSSDLDWLSEVVSHEWIHNYLTLRPLGVSYMDNPEMRVINETTASIAGKEIGRAVLERFYPELVPAPPAQHRPLHPVRLQKPAEPPAFDFRKEMQITRRRLTSCWQRERSTKPNNIWMNGVRFSGTMDTAGCGNSTRLILLSTAPMPTSQVELPGRQKTRSAQLCGRCAPKAPPWRTSLTAFPG